MLSAAKPNFPIVGCVKRSETQLPQCTIVGCVKRSETQLPIVGWCEAQVCRLV
ncbi:hypothetical protein [Limnospira platensis]|uniref:hypothetical protein n=1 Tax=Limnospira platensis TaxID=118562 RepID=UPI00339A37D8